MSLLFVMFFLKIPFLFLCAAVLKTVPAFLRERAARSRQQSSHALRAPVERSSHACALPGQPGGFTRLHFRHAHTPARNSRLFPHTHYRSIRRRSPTISFFCIFFRKRSFMCMNGEPRAKDGSGNQTPLGGKFTRTCSRGENRRTF